jgi:hypothetical protein
LIQTNGIHYADYSISSAAGARKTDNPAHRLVTDRRPSSAIDQDPEIDEVIETDRASPN